MAEPKKLKNGNWHLRTRYQDPITNEWREKSHTADTRKAVKQKEIDFLAKISRGEVVKKIKLIDFYDIWVETFKKGKVSAGRMEKINLVRKNLIDFFGENQTSRSIDKIKYQKWINWLGTPGNVNKRGLAVETVSNRHNIVKSMFLEAIDMQYIHNNPTRNIKIVGQKPVHQSEKTISYEDTKKFRAALMNKEDSPSRFFLLTQLHTGSRYQEVAALTWDDLIEEKEMIYIDKAFKYAGREKKFGPTKSEAGVRYVDVPASLFSELKRHRLSQRKDILSGKLKNPRNLVFCNYKDTWPISNSAINKYLKEVCELAEIARISSHSLRHARIDAMILAENDPVYIKSQIGHKEITQSYKYASDTKENRLKNKQKLQEYLKDIL